MDHEKGIIARQPELNLLFSERYDLMPDQAVIVNNQFSLYFQNKIIEDKINNEYQLARNLLILCPKEFDVFILSRNGILKKDNFAQWGELKKVKTRIARRTPDIQVGDFKIHPYLERIPGGIKSLSLRIDSRNNFESHVIEGMSPDEIIEVLSIIRNQSNENL